MKPEIPKDFAVQPLAEGQAAKDKMTCGTCGLSWDDAIPTQWTPTPSARCPFEYFHVEEEKEESVTITSVVDPGWIEFVTGGPEGMCDVFMSNGHCGYWLRRYAHDSVRGFLAYDFGAKDRLPNQTEIDVAIGLWKTNNTLPDNWHRLDLKLARRSWAEGVKRHGFVWYEDGDGPRYDEAIQRGLFNGEALYG